MKKCIICKTIKPLEEYYQHLGMNDGHLNKCKSCAKQQSKERHHEKFKDPNWVEKERIRGKEKYHRLGYRNLERKQIKYKPWKKESQYKNQSRKNFLGRGFEIHHWNYFKLSEWVLMTIKDHRFLHSFLEVNIETRIFKVKESGEYLETFDDHKNFIKDKGLKFIEP